MIDKYRYNIAVDRQIRLIRLISKKIDLKKNLEKQIRNSNDFCAIYIFLILNYIVKVMNYNTK